jgi:hypothetical protein
MAKRRIPDTVNWRVACSSLAARLRDGDEVTVPHEAARRYLTALVRNQQPDLLWFCAVEVCPPRTR